MVAGTLVGVPLSWVPLTAVPAADGALARLRRPRRRPGRHRQVLHVARRRAVDDVPHGGDRHRGAARLSDLHGQPDGGRQAAGSPADAAADLPQPERDQPRPAGGRDRDCDRAGVPARTLVAVPDRDRAVAAVRRAAGAADRRRRHADGHFAAERVCRPVGRGDGVRARKQAAHHRRRARRIVGPDPVDHHVPRDEPLVHQRAVRRVRPGAGGRAERSSSGPRSRRRPRTSCTCSRTRTPWSSSRATAWRSPRRSTACATCATSWPSAAST